MFIRNPAHFVSRCFVAASNFTARAASLGITLAAALALIGTPAKADTFGSGANAFTIDFVNVGNAGNADDTGAGGGSYSSPYGGVPYSYRIGTYEVTQDAIVKATASGLAGVASGPWSGSQPAANMTWFEAAAFVNWLNTSTGHQAAYQLDAAATALTLWSSAEAWQAGGENLYRHKNAKYFMPSEDEWYKAAFHKNDGATANYWDYATGSNTAPTAVASGTGAGTAVSDFVTSSPANVDNNGGLSAYGTRGQNGNVWESLESAFTAPNDSSSENRAIRGGGWHNIALNMSSSFRSFGSPSGSRDNHGFRVASVGATVNNPGGVFVTGHDPDFHAVLGGNFVGARNTLKRGVEYVTYNKVNPRLLLVTDLRNPGGVECDSRLAMPVCGFTNYAVADYGSGTAGVLNLNTVQFSDYDAIIVASDFGGWLRQDELDVLNSRTAEILSYVNNGGGLVVLSEAGNRTGGGYPGTAHSRYGFLPFLVSAIDLNQHESSITVTPAGTALGLTNTDVNGNFSHSYFSASGGMDVIDKDASGRALTLATRKGLTIEGVLDRETIACETTATVPGTANPYLAGMPAGSTAYYYDSAPAQSPTLVGGFSIDGGDRLRFASTGTTGFAPGVAYPAEGNTGYPVTHVSGAENGISTYVGAPANALVGVFLDDSQPNSTPAPAALSFSATARDFSALTPGLKQVFYIGDGKNSAGEDQIVVAPVGATRLFLGVVDGLGWYNNVGALTVTITNEDCVDDGGHTEPPSIGIGGPPQGGGIPIFGTANPANPGHTTGTISGTGHPGCTIEVTVSDPTHTESVANNSVYTTIVGANGNWSITLTLDDCHPFISIVQICDGVRSGPVSWQTYVDGTPPVFVGGGGGPGDGTDIAGSGGMGTITLVGTASDSGTEIPGGGVGYEWYLILPGSGGTETRQLLLGGGSGTVIFEGEPGDYILEVVVTDTAGNRLVKRCVRRILPQPPLITGGVPVGTVIWGGGGGAGVNPGNPGRVTGTIRGTGHPGCTIEVTVSDPTHPASTANNMAYTTLVGADGNWSIDLTLDDCHPAISIVQICNGMRSEPVRWQVYVDGTRPVFTGGGPGDGIDTAGSGGTAWIILNGGASDADTHIPGGGVGYKWYLITGGAGGEVRTLLAGNGSAFQWEVEPGEYVIEVEVSDGAGNLLVKRCVRRVIPAPPEIDGGIPATGAIFGTADPAHPGRTTGTISGTGHAGCTIELTVSDPTHAESTANNQTYATIVGADGRWSFALTLDDCHPTFSIVQICNGMRSTPVTWQAYVDGTPPVLIGGLADGIDYISTGGIAQISLNGSASDDSHVPGGLRYRWVVIGANGVRLVVSRDPVCALELPLGDWTIELVATDPAGNQLVKSCVRRVLKRPTTLGCPEITASFGDNVTLNATLLDGLTNLAISGKAITYQLNGQPVSSTFSTLLLPGVYEILAAFAGDDIYQPCTATQNCHLTIKATPGKITGGGSIDQRIRNFGFIVQTKTQNGAASFSGNLEFQDKSRGIDLKSASITMIAISPDRLRGAFTGTATMNKTPGYTFTAWVDDLAEPGAGVDKFRVVIKGPAGFTYDSAQVATKGGILDKGGNIQIHKALQP